jgi:hypothetical protein
MTPKREYSPAQARAVKAYRRRQAEAGGAQVAFRLSPEAVAWLDARRLPDESRAAALKRLAGVPG